MIGRRSIAPWAALLLLAAAGPDAGAAKAGKSAKAKPKPKQEKQGTPAAPAGREVEASCNDSDAAALWWSPAAPAIGQPIKIMAVGDGGGDLSVTDPHGDDKALTTARHDGPPGSLTGEFTPTRPGSHQLIWRRGGKPIACRKLDVAAKPAAPPTAAMSSMSAMSVGKAVWAAPHGWDRRYENLYSAWIATLFDAPVDQSLDFRPLHQALRDPARNFLYGYLGLREDDPKNKAAIAATPDCADLPYFLRAYFSWKLGLPFGFRDCDRGTESRPPRCTTFYSNDDAPSGKDTLAAVKSFFRQLANRVQSGSARTGLDDDATDYYPVPLERSALRPGVIYADPYGHVMVVVKWVDQTADKGGLLLAVDGQPDTSIGRKRFWEGTFLFANDVKSAGPGFKAFRPIARGADGKLEPAANAAIGGKGDAGHAPFSDEQKQVSADGFYARMGKLINPQGLDAEKAYRETLDALVEQMTVRVGSVDNGEKYQKEKGAGQTIPMPDGAKIFETTGPWEDYATPSRDMRLLIAMNVLLGYPDRIVKHPELFNLGGKSPAAVRDQIAKLHASLVGTRGITYTRSDGSPWKLTVSDLLARRAALEIAYNPNDCVEVRWGAADGTPEASTCKRHLPPDQKAKMAEYRAWFHDARRPSR
jgi:hypothetical protein